MSELLKRMPKSLVISVALVLGGAAYALAQYVVSEHLAVDAKQTTDLEQLTLATTRLAIATDNLRDVSEQNSADIRELRVVVQSQLIRTEALITRQERRLDKTSDPR